MDRPPFTLTARPGRFGPVFDVDGPAHLEGGSYADVVDTLDGHLSGPELADAIDSAIVTASSRGPT